ncbi:MAG: hypothetical protein KGL39_57105 [Patescibacteria group bacterium]|nr:hypothetical protein [Patescibacteria group bacterium]
MTEHYDAEAVKRLIADAYEWAELASKVSDVMLSEPPQPAAASSIMHLRAHMQKLVAALRAAQEHIEGLEKFKKRLEWLHTCGDHDKDLEGFEWGVARVQFDTRGKVVQAYWTLSDHSDLDAEMERCDQLDRALADSAGNENHE